MSKPYDASIKDLAAQGPTDFVACFDGPTRQSVTLLNVDLSTVTTAADETVRAKIEAIREIDALEELTERLLAVSSWVDLLA